MELGNFFVTFKASFGDFDVMVLEIKFLVVEEAINKGFSGEEGRVIRKSGLNGRIQNVEASELNWMRKDFSQGNINGIHMKESGEEGFCDGLFDRFKEGTNVGSGAAQVAPLVLQAMCENSIRGLGTFVSS